MAWRRRLVGELVAEGHPVVFRIIREGSSLVVRAEVPDVLEEDDRGASGLAQQTLDLEEEVAALLVVETMARPRLFFLLTPAMLNGWHGKPAGEDVVLGKSRCRHVTDVVRFAGPKLRMYVRRANCHLDRVDALTSGLLEPQPDASDPGEQVDEPEGRFSWREPDVCCPGSGTTFSLRLAMRNPHCGWCVLSTSVTIVPA